MRVTTTRTPDGAVSIEPFGATLRYHPTGGYGAPFTFTCTLTVFGNDVHLFAGRGDMTPAAWRAIQNALRQAGFENALFDRRNKQRKRHVKSLVK